MADDNHNTENMQNKHPRGLKRHARNNKNKDTI